MHGTSEGKRRGGERERERGRERGEAARGNNVTEARGPASIIVAILQKVLDLTMRLFDIQTMSHVHKFLLVLGIGSRY